MFKSRHRPVFKPLTEVQRHLLFLSAPPLWPCWPFLPLVRRKLDQQEEGLLYDIFHVTGQTGFSATVFLTNLFQVPGTLAEFLALPREVHDTPLELFEAGWRVD